MTVDWDHLYILGWYDHNKEGFLSTWCGDDPIINVVVFLEPGDSMPLWGAPVPPGARLEVIPEGEDVHEYAKVKGGLYAFGWYQERGVNRKHPIRLEGWNGDLKSLAKALGALRYDKLSEFLEELSRDLFTQSEADYKRDRSMLADDLRNASRDLATAKRNIDSAWDICKPHMKE